MVRVISVHHFDSQVIQTCEEPLAAASAPPDRILTALPHHVVEVHDLTQRGPTFSFPTVDRVSELRYCTTGEASPEQTPVPKRKRGYVSIAQHIYDYLRDSKSFVAHYDRLKPELFKDRTSAPPEWYCLSDATAEILFRQIEPRLSPRSIVLEMSPGLGLITQKLLSAGVSTLYAYEPDPYFNQILSSLAASHPQLTVIPKHFLSIRKEEFKGRVKGEDRHSRLLPSIEPADWKSDPIVKIIGAVPSEKFIQYMISCVTFQKGIVLHGRPELLFVTTPELVVKLSYDRTSQYSPLCSKKFSKLLLFSIYFDLEVLCEVDGKTFVPWFRKRKGRAGYESVTMSTPELLLFVRAVPKRDLYDAVPPHMLKTLWFFFRQAVLKSKSKVIPFLEKWVPGVGPVFIAKGLSILTEFRDLSPPEILDLFQTFINHPDYDSCLFEDAVDSSVFRAQSEALGYFDGEIDTTPKKTIETQDDSVDQKSE